MRMEKGARDWSLVVIFTVFLAAITVLGSARPAHAASSGCTILNAGGGDTVIPAGNVVNTVINQNLDAGEKITIVITGNPNSVRIGTNPGNVAISAAPGNLNLTVTLAAGITGITISGQASGGGNTLITFRCMSTTTTSASPSAPAGPTPDETSAAVENSTSAVNTVRQPTSPNALPGVSDGADKSSLETQYDRIDAGLKELEAQNSALEASTESNERRIRALFEQAAPGVTLPVRPQKDPVPVGDGDNDDDRAYSDGFYGVESSWTGYRSMYEAGQQAAVTYNNELAKIEAKLAEAGLLSEYQDLRAEQQENELATKVNERRIWAKQSELSTLRSKLNAEDAKRTLPPYQWFTGSSGRAFDFNIDISTDKLRHWAQANLDETAAPQTVLPPLTIAGKPVNIWIRGRGTLFDAQNRFGNDGWAGHVLTGIAMKANDRITVGAFGSYLTSDTETDFNNSEIESHSAGGGAYVNMKIVDSISAGLSINHERGEQDIKIGTTTGSADTQLTAVGASLQGSWYVDPVFISPSVSVSYSDYIRDQYTDSTGTLIPSSRSRDTTIAAAATASRTYNFEDGGWFTSASPRVSATLNYFARENRSLRVTANQIIDLEKWGGNVGTGVTLATDGNSTISVDLGVIGIGQDTLGYTGQLQVDFGF
ncbi:MAG: autotransporter domain-containing protein [Candidatus Phaeomarinobacter sp.]